MPFPGPEIPSDIGNAYIERSCVPYRESFAVVGGNGIFADTVAYFEPVAETFVILEDRLTQPKNNVAAFSVNANIFPSCD